MVEAFHWPFINYVSTVLGSSKLSVDGWLSDMEFFVLDTPAKFDVTTADNKGFTTRQQWTLNSRKVNVKARIPIEIFNQSGRYLPTNTDFEIILDHADDTFRLIQTDGTGPTGQALTATSVIKFSDMELEIMRVTPKAEIMNDIESRLLSSAMQFPYRRFLSQSYQLLANQTMLHVNLYNRDKPEAVIVYFISTKAYSGNANLNPFRFEDPGVQDLVLYFNGVAYPDQRGYMNIPADIYYTQPFFDMLTFQGVMNNDACGLVDRRLYTEGAFFFVFDLTTNPVGSLSRENPVLGNTSLKLTMSGTGNAENIQVMTLGVFPATLSIDASHTAVSSSVPGTA